MTLLEWGIQALLVLALGASLPAVLRLERVLSSLGSHRADLAESAKVFVAAVQDAEAAIARLRQASEGAGRDVARQVAAAERTADDLRFLLDRAEGEADRLDIAVRGLRGPPAAALPAAEVVRPTPPSPPPEARKAESAAASIERAQAELDVLRAIRGARVS